MNKDKLDLIFELQSRFDSEVVNARSLQDIKTEEWIQKESLAMFSEIAELLSEVNFKWWKNPKEINYDKVKEELIDILHFLTSTCIKVGMDANEVCARYIEKNKENFNRQYGKSEKTGYEIANLELQSENVEK
ncbi:MAG: dUTPase [Christensenellaceae bacterium]|jgi:dimeric dUTPase (all-alpha-NTP-PPase superfamily)|nr:dUTPase [Christensenellaceae bacterium]